MLFRNCAGGVVFHGDSVFLLKNEKDEWVLPKGIIRDGALSRDVAQKRVLLETGIKAEIISTAGETSYEFYSISRKKPVCNQIVWYIMRAETPDFKVDTSLGFQKGRYFHIDEAINRITYSQDKALLNSSYRRYCQLIKDGVVEDSAKTAVQA